MIERWANIFIAAAMLLVTWVGIVWTQETAKWGGSPPKQLIGDITGPYDPLVDVAGQDSAVTIGLSSGGAKLDNLLISLATLKNEGSTVRAEDMVDPPAVTAEPHWRIINVVSASPYARKPLEWERVSDREFRIKRTVINKGDFFYSRVYLTWDGPNPQPNTRNSIIKWTATLDNGNIVSSKPLEYRQSSVMINLWDWGIAFTVFCYFIYHMATISLLIGCGFIDDIGRRSAVIICTFGCVNLVAAASTTVYIFGPALNGEYTISPLTHLSFLLNLAVLVYLWQASKRARSATTEAINGSTGGDGR